MTDHDSVRVYYGSAPYSSHKALKQMEEPHVMISAHTMAADSTWPVDDLFVDSGGYSLMLDTGEHPPPAEYIDQVVEMGGDRFALQDYPCEPDILDEYGRTVTEHQERTIERAAECLAVTQDRDIDATPVSVLQGWEVEDYVRHIDRQQEMGTLTEDVAIGSVCRRGQLDEIREIITTVRDELPAKHTLHAFGVKYEALKYPDVRDAVDSVDTAAWFMFANQSGRLDGEPLWRAMAAQYLDYWRKVESITSHEMGTVASLDGQKSFADFA